MDSVGKPHKQLGAEAYYSVIINAPMTCLTSKETVKSLMVERKNVRYVSMQKQILKCTRLTVICRLSLDAKSKTALTANTFMKEIKKPRNRFSLNAFN